MQTKNKPKISNRKKTVKREMIKTNLIVKLKKSLLTKKMIATALGYKSRSTINHWIKKGEMPLSKFNAVKRLLGIGK